MSESHKDDIGKCSSIEDTLFEEIASLRSQLDQANAELQECRKDREMLNLLDDLWVIFSRKDKMSGLPKEFLWYSPKFQKVTSIRQAISAAMNVTKG
jgi:hypothetical protein